MGEVEVPDLGGVGGRYETCGLEEDADYHWGLGAEFPHDKGYRRCDYEREGELETADEGVVD